MSSPDFRSLLQKPADEIKRPPVLPAGTYHGIVSKYEFLESKEKKTPFVRFSLGLRSAGEDVDAEEIKEVDLSTRQLRRDYFITEDALYRLKEFLESLGIAMSGRPLAECIPDALNQSVIIEVVQQLNPRDPTAPPFNDVKAIRGE
jgi:hypothetical protein